ncbi:MAG TPA: hypothetical protein PKA63_00130 [Oligoflexia bacterium]|nr:hypothetical protein [Oligoflexia bacterium]HMP47055.1 hypothetical protein [Oligoflexia bacterium]
MSVINLLKNLMSGQCRFKSIFVVFFAFTIFISIINLIFNLPEDIILDGDSSHFIGLAKSIYFDNSYQFNHRYHTRFPPGYPLIIAGFMYFSKGDFNMYHLVYLNISLLFLSLLFLFFILRRYVSPVISMGIIAVFIASPYVIQLATSRIYSEFSFVFFLFLSLNLLHYLEKSKSVLSSSIYLISASLAVASVLMIRTIGIALIFAIMLRLFFEIFHSGRVQEKFVSIVKMLLVIVPGLLFNILWKRWTSQRSEQLWAGEYMHEYSLQFALIDPHRPMLGNVNFWGLISRVRNFIVVQAAHISEFISAQLFWINPEIYSPMVILPLILLGIGICRMFFESKSMEAVLVLFYLGIFSLWPWDENLRFILPVFPFLLLFLISGAGFISRCNPSHIRYAVLTLAGSFLVLFFFRKFFNFDLLSLEVSSAPSSRQSMISAFFWLGAVVLFGFNRSSLFIFKILSFVRIRSDLIIKSTLSIILMLSLFKVQDIVAENRSSNKFTSRKAEVYKVADYISNNVPPEKIIVSTEEALLHQLTGHRILPFPITTDSAIFRQLLREYRPSYLVAFDDIEYPYFEPTEIVRIVAINDTYPGLLELEQKGEGYFLYRINL